MDLSATNNKGLTLDEVLQDVKTELVTKGNYDNNVEEKLSKRAYIIPSIISDPSKYIKKKVDKTKLDIKKIYEKQEIYDKFEKDKKDFLEERNKDFLPTLKDIDELYLKGRTNMKGLDEHAYMDKLDCKSRTDYCFTNKELSKMCFKEGNHIHDTYILPCKLRVEMKKLMNYIVNDMDIELYKDSDYLRKSVKYHIISTLPKFNFSEEEIDSLINSARNIEQKSNIFTMTVNSSDISVIPMKDGRGIFIEYLLRLFKINADLFKKIIDKYINNLIVYYKYTEFDAIDSGFKFLNTLVLGSETVDDIEEYYKDLTDKHKRMIRGELDSDSE
tara:strand:+ start:2265 stop:3254 length:990 start_codon:yes stop_codon:yes gene_type:complete